MSIQPIDLQVLFSRLGEVGKEQSAIKDGSLHNQAVQGSELAKKTEHNDHAVNETHEIDKDGVQNIRDEKKRRRSKSGSEKEAEEDNEKENDKAQEILRDPYLGKNIDITG